MSDSRWWLVCYDVCDPKRLQRCARHVEGYGERIQYSVFRCWMSRSQVEQLRWELTELLAPEDRVLLIPLCSGCVSGILSIHDCERPEDWSIEPIRFRIL
ncbi:MAG: CRISPR-associated endonuclease Cas2 [Gemmataceae bacterium]|nr:CRISPR-associated endonuclease Cas2 [Gemmataceae bacterium]